MSEEPVSHLAFINILRVPSYPECAVCCHPIRCVIEALLYELKNFDEIVDQFNDVALLPSLELNRLILRAHVEHLHPSPHRDWLWAIHADAQELTPNMWARGELGDSRVIERLAARSSGTNSHVRPGTPGVSANQRILLLSTARGENPGSGLGASATKKKEPQR